MRQFEVTLDVTRTITAERTIPVQAESWDAAAEIATEAAKVLDFQDLVVDSETESTITGITGGTPVGPATNGTVFPPAYVPPVPATDGYRPVRTQRVNID